MNRRHFTSAKWVILITVGFGAAVILSIPGYGHGLLYVEIIDRPGTDHDQMKVRSYVTRDNWETARWDRLWEKPIESPDLNPVNNPVDQPTP